MAKDEKKPADVVPIDGTQRVLLAKAMQALGVVSSKLTEAVLQIADLEDRRDQLIAEVRAARAAYRATLKMTAKVSGIDADEEWMLDATGAAFRRKR